MFAEIVKKILAHALSARQSHTFMKNLKNRLKHFKNLILLLNALFQPVISFIIGSVLKNQ